MKSMRVGLAAAARALRSLTLAAALGFLWLAAAPSNANAITWNLSNIPLSDGGSLSGSFSFNVYGFFDAWNLSTTGGSLTSFTYSRGDINADNDGPPVTLVAFYANPPANYFGALVIKFASDLLTASGIDAIIGGDGGPSFECDGFLSQAGECSSPIRYINGDAFATSGDAIALPGTPLPPAAPLFAGGLLLLGMLWWRRNRFSSPWAL